jgi:hypothetical protein
MTKIILCLGNVFLHFFVFLFLVNYGVVAQHACNQSCTGAANITCNETTGNLSYNRGSCNTGLACYSGASNRCRNPYCPTDTDCNCANFSIQGEKRPNKTPFSQQTITLFGGNNWGSVTTTNQPYSFNNLPSNRIFRVSASAPSGSTVGYTLCYDNTNCHNNNPVANNQVYVCRNRLTSYASLWWHYTPQTANTTNITGPTTVFIGDTVVFQAQYTNGAASLTDALMYVYQDSCLGTALIRNESFSGPGIYTFNWTPTEPGTYTIYTRADSASASCIGFNTCIGSPPNYSCVGPNTSLTITVNNLGPWFKLKNTAFYKIGNFTNGAVTNVKKFSDSDPDDTTQRYTIIGDAGNVLIGGNYNPQPPYNPLSLSANNWKTTGYSPSQILLSNFISYIKSRKEYSQIASLNNLVTNKINLVSGNQTIDNSILSKAPFVLIVENGDITISADFNNTAPIKPVALVVVSSGKKIIFGNNLNYANGLFISDGVDIGTATTGLKIKGNLISKNPVSLTRNLTDNSRPSLFVVFEPTIYLGLLDKLSISKYDWKQLQ